METKQDWKRVHCEHYAKGPAIEERIGIVLLFGVPIVFLVAIGCEIVSYYRGL